MRVKVALPMSKPIQQGAFLGGSNGKNMWVTFKDERLPRFCHCCRLLGHDLEHSAQYFTFKKEWW